MPKDLLDEIIAQVRAAAPELPVKRIDAIAQKIRRDWGGTEVYIRKAPAAGKALRLATELAAGRPLREAFEAAGVRRSQGYALLSRRLVRR